MGVFLLLQQPSKHPRDMVITPKASTSLLGVCVSDLLRPRRSSVFVFHWWRGSVLAYSKGFALTWYRALTWYSSPARLFAVPDDPLLVTGQQGSPSPACRQHFRARNASAESSSEESIKLGHGTKLGRTLC